MDTTILISIAVGLLTFLIAMAMWLSKAKKSTVLLVGLSGAGKTVIFSQLVSQDDEIPKTFTSMKENSIEMVVGKKKINRKIIDFPGHERLREKMISYVKMNDVCKIVFVVDASTFAKNYIDVAELLYNVCLENKQKAPILVTCHKQDVKLAKNETEIEKSLEKEIGVINITRSASLKGTDGSDSNNNAILTKNGQEFAWKDLRFNVVFGSSSSVQNDLADVRDFVNC